ncbi:glycosyl transferase family group 2-domain-containing protein [Stachybotrys elegans]|uniref:Glycosyl transferase family group 2-domain-containing protein n=1 Tax=Stachybotrys elegans TaxID=80388 RepID=A0A8K0WM76_9HYPO|nr:glycosyl transferase family group 2-domain-containing protein [Stachybotrys elegans]
MIFSNLWRWLAQRSPGIVLIATVWFSYSAISREAHLRAFITEDGTAEYLEWEPDAWTVPFVYYCLSVSFLLPILCVRACWSVRDLTLRLRAVESDRLTVVGDADLRCPEVIHAIIVPNYSEDIEVLRETLEVLAAHPQARDSYRICLAMEQREDGGKKKASTLVEEFHDKFSSIQYTLHPADIAGDAAGKGSNVAWAASRLSEAYAHVDRKNVVITVIDADSHLLAPYFTQLTKMHIEAGEKASCNFYAAPIIFDRNSQQVNAIVRIADIFWGAYGISGLYSGSTISPPTSVYSLPLELVDLAGGWDPGSEAIGEDLHMYLKCFFALNGRLIPKTILSAVSQTDVPGLHARYKQALRHMWGALDCGYILRKSATMWMNRKRSCARSRPLHLALDLDAFDVDEIESGKIPNIKTWPLERPNWYRTLGIGYRLFEGHVLPLQGILVAVSTVILAPRLALNPQTEPLTHLLAICTSLRHLGLGMTIVYLYLYGKFFRLCASRRSEAMDKAGLSTGMHFSKRTFWISIVDFLASPVVLPLFAILPGVQAQVSHFWTSDLAYKVSDKAVRGKK